MQGITLIRRYELGFIIGLAIIYVVRRLLEEVQRIDDLVEVVIHNRGSQPFSEILRPLNFYNHTLNNNVPLIGGVLLVLLAWLIFHYEAYPRLTGERKDERTWLYAGLTLTLLVTAAVFYHAFKRQVDFRYDISGAITGMKIYSTYSKRNVLADAIGLVILVGTYELVSQIGYYLNQKSTLAFRNIGYLFWLPIGLVLLFFALFFRVFETFWQSPLRELLLFFSIVIQIYLLQNVVYNLVLPSVRDVRTTEFVGRLLVFLVLWLAINLMVWGARTKFTYPGSGLNMGLLLLTLFVSGLIAVLRKGLNKEKVELQTQVTQTSAELAGLQSQINPHFLFNALNSLYATALRENSEKTADGIQKLGDMMRFMLQENNRDRIPLAKEIDYLRNYIELQRMRLDESHGIEIRVMIQEPDREVFIAPMLLIPFVENAFKHGISLRHPSWIFVTLTLDLTTIFFKVHNSIQPTPADDPEKDHSGIGLENVRKRLELIYADRHTLAIQASERDFFVGLTIRY